MSSKRKGNSRERRRRRDILLNSQKGKCFWCEDDLVAESATLDELLPRYRGGTACWDNIVVSCRPCNLGRGDFVAPAWSFLAVAEREKNRTNSPPSKGEDKPVTNNRLDSVSHDHGFDPPRAGSPASPAPEGTVGI